jgi:hypothetical protein
MLKYFRFLKIQEVRNDGLAFVLGVLLYIASTLYVHYFKPGSKPVFDWLMEAFLLLGSCLLTFILVTMFSKLNEWLRSRKKDYA